MPDVQLLRDFAGNGNETAFREIVGRYTDPVYSAALRQVESSAAAADIAQSVFTDLARKAGSLAKGGAGAQPYSLAGWLHRATRYAALNYLRDARRRATNERQAMEQLLTNSESAAEWEQVRPVLDEALDSLGNEDREALLLRYFKNQDFRAVGLALGVSDDAAQKRVSRAVERLREVFSKRKVTIGASGLVVLISANAVQSAPVGLAAAISAAALATGTTVISSGAIAVTKTIAMTTLQKALVAATVVALAGTGIYEAHQAAKLRAQNETLQQQQAPLAGQIQQLQHERDEATNRLAELVAENSRLKSNSDQNELLRLRGEVGILRAQLGDENRTKHAEQPPLQSAREYFSRGQKHAQEHEYEAALDDLNKAIELDPDLADAYTERAALYAQNLPTSYGGYAKAIADYTRYFELKPKDASFRHNRGLYYEQLGQYDDAIADYSMVIEDDSMDFSHEGDGTNKLIALDRFYRGRIYQWHKKDYNKAISDYTAAIQLDPQLDGPHRYRGECYQSLGEPEKAQQDFAIEPESK